MFQVGLWLIALVQISQCLEVNKFPEKDVEIYMGESVNIYYNITGNLTGIGSNGEYLSVWSEDEHVAQVVNKDGPFISAGNITLNGVFLGVTQVHVSLEGDIDDSPLQVRVIRPTRAIDKAFTGSVAILVSLIYVNFGCALNLQKLREILRRPIGPVIGLLGQFLAMPLLSYGLGLLFFPNRADMRLGLLFVGVSPAGGASNVWTCVLDGNIDLSVTMTTISTFAAFGMMPLWLFTLGQHVFEHARVSVPYSHVASLAVALLVPLAIGCALQKWLPKVADFLARALKAFSAILITFIVVFAIVTNWYLFSLFTWQIALAGLSLPFCGYVFGWTIGKWIVRRCNEDAIAIAIETGIQNTGIAIFLLRFGLPQPQADLTTIVPVAVAVMTPLPLCVIWMVRKFFPRKEQKLKDDSLPRPETPGLE